MFSRNSFNRVLALAVAEKITKTSPNWFNVQILIIVDANPGKSEPYSSAAVRSWCANSSVPTAEQTLDRAGDTFTQGASGVLATACKAWAVRSPAS